MPGMATDAEMEKLATLDGKRRAGRSSTFQLMTDHH